MGFFPLPQYPGHVLPNLLLPLPLPGFVAGNSHIGIRYVPYPPGKGPCGPIPDGEIWEFAPGEVVRWAMRVFSGGEQGLAAFQRVESEPEGSP